MSFTKQPCPSGLVLTCPCFECLLQEAGGIVSIRLVLDFETGKPKGDHFWGVGGCAGPQGTGYTHIFACSLHQCLALVAASPHVVAEEYARIYFRIVSRECVFCVG